MFPSKSDQSLAERLDQLPMKIELPEALRLSMEVERGVVDSSPFEARRTARFRCRGIAVLDVLFSPLELPEQDPTAVVIVRDVSRTGLGIITHQQYFPDQLIRVQLENSIIEGRVARARKIAANCFEIGSITGALTRSE